MRIRAWCGLLVMVLCSIDVGRPVLAQTEYPSRPVRLVASVPPGSPPDLVARLLSEPLGRILGHPVLVENRPGANQTIGLAAVAAATPDGQVLGIVSLPTAVVPALMDKMPYDTLRDFAPIREIAWTANVLVVRDATRFPSLDVLIREAKANPGKLTFASGGNGTPAHVTAELLKLRAGIDVLHVPFKGALEGVNAVVAGHADFMLASAGSAIPQLRAGKLQALAQATASRLPGLQEIPTFRELGFDGLVVRDWQGIVAPAGTPPAIIKRLSEALRTVLAQSEVQARLRAMSMEPVETSDPDQFSALLTAEVQRWRQVSQGAGIRAE